MTRISRPYFPSATHSQADLQGYAFMLSRDIPLGIIPYRSRQTSSFEVKLAQDDTALQEQLASFFRMRDYGGRDLADAICEFIDKRSHYLAALGETYLEIVSEGDDVGITNKSLIILPHGRIIRVFGKYYQLVPVNDWKKGEPKAVAIPAANIWHLQLPKQLGTPRQHKKLLKRLNHMAESMPDFALASNDLGKSARYDFMLHHKNQERAVEYITSNWGSIPSLRQIKGTTEYYYIVHSLQFSYAQALIREHIVTELNALLLRLEINNSIEVNGLPLSENIKTAINRLEKGEIGFKDALAAAKIE